MVQKGGQVTKPIVVVNIIYIIQVKGVLTKSFTCLHLALLNIKAFGHLSLNTVTMLLLIGLTLFTPGCGYH